MNFAPATTTEMKGAFVTPIRQERWPRWRNMEVTAANHHRD
jgi:hypothetical protein